MIHAHFHDIQYLLRYVADIYAHHRLQFRLVKAENHCKLIVLKIGLRIKAQSGKRHVGGASCNQIPARSLYVLVIQRAEQRIRFRPVHIGKDFRHQLIDDLFRQFMDALMDAITLRRIDIIQIHRYSNRLYRPYLWFGSFCSYRIGNIKYNAIAYAVGIHHPDSFTTAFNPAVHSSVPNIHRRTRRGVRALGIDHGRTKAVIAVKLRIEVQKLRPFRL